MFRRKIPTRLFYGRFSLKITLTRRASTPASGSRLSRRLEKILTLFMTTASGVLFAGGTNDRKFHAYDANSGKLLWNFPTPSGILAPPSSFSVNGKQYIAIVSGYGVDAQWNQGKMHELAGWEKAVPEGGSVWVFALED